MTTHQIAEQKDRARAQVAPSVYTLKEAAAEVGLTVDQWRSWQKRGLIAEGTVVPNPGGVRQPRTFSQSEVDQARAAVERSGRATSEHTITREEAARMLGLTIGQWDQLGVRGLLPPGGWASHPERFGRGGRRKLYTPAEVEQVREAIEVRKQQRPRPTIEGEPAVTVKEAAEMIGISRGVWYEWERRGWAPQGTWIPRGRGKMKAYTHAQIEALKATIERGEHPGAVADGIPDATITRVEAARTLGISLAKWDELRRRGVAPPGRWVQHPRGFGHGGRRKVYTPDEVQKVREALERLEEDRRPTIDGEQAVTVAEAAEIIGISRPLWYLWKRKGWVPEGTWVDRLGAGGEMEVFTPAQIGTLKASIERGEHPGAQDRGGPDHTITRRKAAAVLGITTSMWSQWEQQGIVPRGKKPALSPSLGLGGSRRLWTPAQVEEVRLKAQELGILNPAATPEHTLARDEAARMAGISGQMWAYWSARGVIPPGRWAPHEKGSGKGGLRKLYSPDEVRQARAALDAIGFGRTTNATPEHTITLREAARMLGVTAKGWHDWEQRGLVPTGAWGRIEGNTALRKLYTPAQVEEAREALQQKGVRCFARATTEHTISRQEAMKIIGVSATTWNHWERQARTPVGAWDQARRGRCKLYTRR